MTGPDVLPVAVSCGDPSGIGPEIIAAAWETLRDELPFFMIGDPKHVPAGTRTAMIDAPADARSAMADGLPVLQLAFPKPARPGHPDPENAPGVVEAIHRAVELVGKGAASAICTAPASKRELVSHAGFAFPGQTEFLAHHAGGGQAVMMLASAELKVVPVTTHIPISEVSGTLDAELLETTIRVTDRALHEDFGVSEPRRIAVAGLNPHAGECGVLGLEDATVIAPVCERLRAEGMSIEGPLSADTMFSATARAGYDAAIAMYHDQALIPVKTLAFEGGVNVTLGLPIVRTSPDHGTAFDIAGRGQANPASMIAALRLARKIATARLANKCR
ncbi:MAG: 4-hydroxythreonine-4-phosphate dehydrogenase PdxA [Boseongicola sp. SB0664_bin_43]|uniref:4-hydroxythreonine-4-phosphate dehydrogenase n=1 Tax=Boseongicola sp. SB0664_bin_43 TaxID=2604844 RepID=A0A6B0Y4G8_9RHOB|nr:4-hydroxythreonine-4-phosphate dehydrogenase PdxA [Boseongicola sp. SB0664_bin_43]MYK32464.1 4-hydroxythreonine-4-phosphate dehydrogenase PdxA [Boseongicola sp. SB0670_bin_30]